MKDQTFYIFFCYTESLCTMAVEALADFSCYGKVSVCAMLSLCILGLRCHRERTFLPE